MDDNVEVWDYILSEERINKVLEWHKVRNQVEAYNALTGQNIKIMEDL